MSRILYKFFHLCLLLHIAHAAILNSNHEVERRSENSEDQILIKSTITILVGPTVTANRPGIPPGLPVTIQTVPTGDFQPAALISRIPATTCYPVDFKVNPVLPKSVVPKSSPTGSLPRRLQLDPNPDDNGDDFPPDDNNFPPDNDNFPPDNDNFPPDNGNFPPEWSGRRPRECIICPAVFPICQCRYREHCRYIRRTCFRCAHFTCRFNRNEFLW